MTSDRLPTKPDANREPADTTTTHEALELQAQRGRSSPAASIRSGSYVFIGAEDNLVHRFDLADENRHAARRPR